MEESAPPRNGELTSDYQGGTYAGVWLDDVPHGAGELTTRNGDVFKGVFDNGKLWGEGTAHFQDGREYTGGFRGGQFHGTGRMLYPAGGSEERYEGEWVAGVREGSGELIFGEGEASRFKGKFHKGQPSEGVMQLLDGGTAEGRFQDSKLNGQGKCVYAPGGPQVSFEGLWLAGWRTRGKLVFTEGGRVFDGEFEKDQPCKGALEWGDMTHTGKVDAKGQRCGSGQTNFPDGRSFRGEWVQDTLAHASRAEYPDGSVYTGALDDQFRRHGEGSLVGPQEASRFEGEWREGRMAHGRLAWANGGDVYEGGFDAEERWDDAEASLSFLHPDDGQGGQRCEWRGEARAGELGDGTLTRGDGLVWEGRLDGERRAQGEGVLTWPGKVRCFRGHMDAGKCVRGTLEWAKDCPASRPHVCPYTLRDHEDDEEEKRRSKSKAEGSQDRGLEDALAAGGASAMYASLAALEQKCRATYEGEFSSDGSGTAQLHGQGRLQWSNGDVYEGEFSADECTGEGVLRRNGGQVYTGTFNHGVCTTGVMEGAANQVCERWEGGFDQAGRFHGKGTAQYRAGSHELELVALSGEWEHGTCYRGTAEHSSGCSFEGEINQPSFPLLSAVEEESNGHGNDWKDGGALRFYGRGVVTFVGEDKPPYTHAPDSPGSFPHQLCEIARGLQSQLKGAIAKAKLDLTPLGIWPRMAPVTRKEAQLPEPVAAAVSSAQGAGLSKGLSELERTCERLCEDMESMHRHVGERLRVERATDESRQQRFAGRWTVARSDSMNSEYHAKVAANGAIINAARARLVALQTDREAHNEGMQVLATPLAEHEAKVLRWLREDARRATLVAALQRLHEVSEQATGLFAQFCDQAEALDVIPLLMQGKHSAETAVKETLEALAESRASLSACLDEHATALQACKDSHAVYTKELPSVRAAALQAVLQSLEPAIEAWQRVYGGLTEAVAESNRHKNQDFATLVQTVDDFFKARRNSRTTLERSLLLQELHAAVAGGEAARVRELLDPRAELRVQPDARSEKVGLSALQLAVEQGNTAMIAVLAACRADPNQRTAKGHSLVRVAIAKKQPECVAALVQAKADVDAPEDPKSGMNALMMMARNNEDDVVRLLLGNGAKPDVRSLDGRTALHHAAAAGASKAVHVLVASGASCNVKDSAGNTVLHLSRHLETKTFLCRAGARYKRTNHAKKPAAAGDEVAQLKPALATFYKGDSSLKLDCEPEYEGGPRWVPDDAHLECPLCNTEFGLFTRRHHCRRCGNVVCGDCGYLKVGMLKKHRVCDPCFNTLRLKRK